MTLRNRSHPSFVICVARKYTAAPKMGGPLLHRRLLSENLAVMFARPSRFCKAKKEYTMAAMNAPATHTPVLTTMAPTAKKTASIAEDPKAGKMTMQALPCSTCISASRFRCSVSTREVRDSQSTDFGLATVAAAASALRSSRRAFGSVGLELSASLASGTSGSMASTASLRRLCTIFIRPSLKWLVTEPTAVSKRKGRKKKAVLTVPVQYHMAKGIAQPM
mmetsp:Transcript_111152/g.346412  ORF Transcript_111152/g.346412 Transcript_111152/m.346412 type:complete len:221 (+) Transcript_111152:294-956(+)